MKFKQYKNFKSIPYRAGLKSKPALTVYAILSLAVVGFLANLYFSQPTPIDIRSKAELMAAEFSIYPAAPVMPPNTTVSLTVNAKTHQIGFVMANLTFNPEKIRLAREITYNDVFKNALIISTPEEANTTGQITIALALFDPTTSDMPTAPPTGTFEIAQMTFSAVSTTPGETADLVLTPDSEINGQNEPNTALPYKTTQATFMLNPVPTPTPSEPIPTETPASPTATPESVPAPTVGEGSPPPLEATPTQTPQPTNTPEPPTAPTTTPVEPSPTPILVIPTNPPAASPTPTAVLPGPTNTIAPTAEPTVKPKGRQTPQPTRSPKPKPTTKSSAKLTTPTPITGFAVQEIKPTTAPFLGAENPAKFRSDFDQDKCVNITDIYTILQAVLMSANEPVFDVNLDGKVDFKDVFDAARNFDTQCGITSITK